jgi:actin-like ATPase involved in cell morphogenesis
MTQYLGFDFGTTNSVVSLFDSTTKSLKTIPLSNYSDPRLKVLGEGGLFPSKIGLHNGKYYFGDETSVCSRDFIWSNSKRLLDTTELITDFFDNRPALEVAIGIITGIVHNLKKQNIDIENKMCMTVPSNSYSLQRAQTKLAGEVCGLNVKNLVSEPCAAALSLLDDIEKNKYILVIDIGGGTTDIALLENNLGLMKEISVSGIKKFGGLDIDRAIYDEIKSYFEITTNAEELLLIDECEKIKVELSEKQTSVFQYKGTTIEFTRQSLEKLCESFLLKIEKEINNVLKNAKLEVNDVDKVIPVGGTTIIPQFTELFNRIFGLNKVIKISKDDALTAVSKGGAIAAAIYDGSLKNVEFQQCLEHSVSLRVANEINYENYRCTNALEASKLATELGGYGSHVNIGSDGEPYFYPCESFINLKLVLNKGNSIDTKKLSLLIEKGTPYPAYHAKKYRPERSKSSIAIYETISNEIKNDDSVLLSEWSLRTLRNNEVYVWVEVQYNLDGEIELSAFQVDRFNEDLTGDMFETDISKDDYTKIGQMFTTETLSEKFSMKNIIFDQFGKEEIYSWRDNFILNISKSKNTLNISNEIDENKTNQLSQDRSLHDFFLAIEKSWRDVYLIVLNHYGIKTKKDFEEVLVILKERNKNWKQEEKVNLDDGRFLSKLFLSSEDIKLLKKFTKSSFQEEIKTLHNLTNEYFHRDGRNINQNNDIFEIEKNIAENNLQNRWFEKSQLDPLFFKKISYQYVNVLDEFIKISKIKTLKDIKSSVQDVIQRVILKI